MNWLKHCGNRKKNEIKFEHLEATFFLVWLKGIDKHTYSADNYGDKELCIQRKILNNNNLRKIIIVQDLPAIIIYSMYFFF